MSSNTDTVEAAHKPLFIVVMGVSGTGKSTLGAALAGALGMPFVEGDRLHPASNVEKMTAGVPLTDSDRVPWLELIRATAERRLGLAGGLSGVVISSSALKRSYRDILRGRRDGRRPALHGVVSLSTCFVFLRGGREAILERMEMRSGHFMKAAMLDSQLATLEDPEGEEGVVVVSLLDSTEDQTRDAVDGVLACTLS